MVRRSLAPKVKAALAKARKDKLEQRARLIGAGIILPTTKRRNKYNQVRTTLNGVKYDSLGEAEYASKLNLRVQSGEIVAWTRPPAIVLLDAPTVRGRITYKPDFQIWPNLSDRFYYVDYKGSKITETPTWRLKVKMWAQKIPHELRVAYPSGEEKTVCPARSTSQSYLNNV